MSTANEMKFSFLLKFDSLFEYSAPAYDDRQISSLLNQAQNRVVLETYHSKFEADEKRRRDLEQLIKQESWVTGGVGALKQSSTQIGVHPNGIFFDLPADFLYSIEESAKLTGGIKEVIVKPVKHDSYIANINNPYKQPCSWLVWRMDYSRLTDATGITPASVKRTELIHDGTGIIAYRLRYLRAPSDIVVNEFDPTLQRHCVLDQVFHDSIVSEAVKIAQAAVNPQEYQISAVEAESSKK